MKKKEAQPIGDVIQEYLKALRIEGKMKQVSLINSYESVVGKTIAKATNKIYFKGASLFIELNSSVIRNELALHKERLIEALNEKAGDKLIDKIILK